MWIQRTPEEVIQWQKAAEKQTRSIGLLIGVMAWIILVVVVSACWHLSFQTGFPGGRAGHVGGFWIRLPIFGIFGVPIIFIVLRYVSMKAARRTICPKCDISGHDNVGMICKCGGSFVPTSTVKWVEK
jgi:uncharacterized membrane protein